MANFRNEFKRELDSLTLTPTDEVKRQVMQKVGEVEVKPKRMNLRVVLIAAVAVIVLASLGVGVYASVMRFYVPMQGIFEEYPYEIYAAEEGFTIGGNFIDTVMRTCDEDGNPIMSVHALCVADVNAHRVPDITLDFGGGTVITKPAGHHNSRGYALYTFEGVPETNVFTMTVGGESREVELTQVDRSSYGITDVVNIGGADIMLYPLPGGGNSFAVYAEYVGADIAAAVTGGLATMPSDVGVDIDCKAYDSEGNVYQIGMLHNDIRRDENGRVKLNSFVMFTRDYYANVGSRAELEAIEAEIAKLPLEDRLVKGRVESIEVTQVDIRVYFEDDVAPIACEIVNPVDGADATLLNVEPFASELVNLKILDAKRVGNDVVINYVDEPKTEDNVYFSLGVRREYSSGGGNSMSKDGTSTATIDFPDTTIETVQVLVRSISINVLSNEIIEYK